MTNEELSFCVDTIPLDENYRPTDNTRVTTNFANLARGANRRENLRKALRMIDNRFNALADWDNPAADRYRVELQIVSVALEIGADDAATAFPMIEMLEAIVIDTRTGERSEGIVGNNFSSYLRDYDFSILLSRQGGEAAPEDFGVLHGKLFRHFLRSPAYRERFRKEPVICLSVSSSRTYHRTDNCHPVLGIEYRQDDLSATDRYFAHMGLHVRFFMPRGSAAPLAFYFAGDLTGDYTNLELIGTISTMETFQKIYRPEIYNANSEAGRCYRPSLDHQDYSLTQIVYDREERSRLALEQGRFAEEHFIRPYGEALRQWSATVAL